MDKLNTLEAWELDFAAAKRLKTSVVCSEQKYDLYGVFGIDSGFCYSTHYTEQCATEEENRINHNFENSKNNNLLLPGLSWKLPTSEHAHHGMHQHYRKP